MIKNYEKYPLEKVAREPAFKLSYNPLLFYCRCAETLLVFFFFDVLLMLTGRKPW